MYKFTFYNDNGDKAKEIVAKKLTYENSFIEVPVTIKREYTHAKFVAKEVTTFGPNNEETISKIHVMEPEVIIIDFPSFQLSHQGTVERYDTVSQKSEILPIEDALLQWLGQ